MNDESREDLNGFWRHFYSRVAQPDFLYGTFMAIAFVCAFAILVGMGYLLARLYRIKMNAKQRRQDTITVSQLTIPTLNLPSNNKPTSTQQLQSADSPKMVPRTRPIEELISEHILNLAQPNQARSGGAAVHNSPV